MDAYRQSPAPASTTIRRFRPSGDASGFAIAWAIGAAVAVGVGIGVVPGLVVAVLAQWIVYAAVWPIPIGVAVGTAVAWAVSRAKLRSPGHAFAAAAIGAVLAVGVVHLAQYDHANHDRDDAASFGNYLTARAHDGVTMFSSPKSSPRVTGGLMWALWIAQLALAVGIAGTIAARRAQRPFCAECNAWFSDHPTRLASGGAGTARFVGKIASALDAGEIDVIATELAAPAKAASTYVLIGHPCATCSSLAVTLRAVGNNGKKLRITDNATWTMTAADAQAITAAIADHRAAGDRASA